MSEENTIVSDVDHIEDAPELIEDVAAEVEVDVAREEPVQEVRDGDLGDMVGRTIQMFEQRADANVIDEENRKVSIALSSEEPVDRHFGREVLAHDEKSIDLSFLSSGRAPLLLDHDPTKQIGVIESVDLDGSARRLRATVRFGKGALAQEAFTDVVDGIKANISVGYRINKMELADKSEKDGPTYRATNWKPMEASLVSIPADDTVGVGRSDKIETSVKPIPIVSKETIMSEETKVDVAGIRSEGQKAGSQSAAQIFELGRKHGQEDMALRAVNEGATIEQFRGQLLDVIGSTGSRGSFEAEDIGMTNKEVKRFSLMRAMHALANPNDRRAQEAAAFEFECSHAAASQYGRSAQGIMLPTDVLRNWDMSKRALNTSDDGELFGTDFRGGEFIDVLRNSSSVMQAGARMLSGLSGNVEIPKKATAAQAAWLASEGADTAESEMTVGQVTLSPKDLGAHTHITRRMLQQTSLDLEALVRDDLVQAMALSIDLAGLEGTGANGQPTGILGTTGVNQVTNFAAANPTFAEVVSLETAVDVDNALAGNLAYILRADMKGALKTTEKATNTGQFVYNGNEMNGYRSIVSNQGTAGNLYFGNFNDLLIGMWGGMDLTVDPYSNSKSGTLRVVAIQTVDVAVRHAQSFAFGNDGA